MPLCRTLDFSRLVFFKGSRYFLHKSNFVMLETQEMYLRNQIYQAMQTFASKQHAQSRSSLFSLTPKNQFQTIKFSFSRNAFKRLLKLDVSSDASRHYRIYVIDFLKFLDTKSGLSAGFHYQQLFFSKFHSNFISSMFHSLFVFASGDTINYPLL